jgi:hypothetical protein
VGKVRFSSGESERNPFYVSFSTMRRLALHASALSDAEYELYTAILRDIALADDDNATGSSGATDDAYFESLNIGVREVRAWLRGRYSSLPSSTIDQVCFLGILSAHSILINFVDSQAILAWSCS